jgi:hypothetical protein
LSNGDKVIVEGQMKAQPDTEVKIVSTRTIDELTKDALGFSVDRKREAIETDMKVNEAVDAPAEPAPETSPLRVQDDEAASTP